METHEATDDGFVEFWNQYLTIQCKGCGTINFCQVSMCSEEEVDSLGRRSLVQHKKIFPEISENQKYVNLSRISALENLPKASFDMAKLVQLINELNRAYQSQSFLSCVYLVRAIIDHIPPVFGMKTFNEVVNNYKGDGKSFRDAMKYLQDSSRKIADLHLHSQIRKTEILPTETQVEFRSSIDLLLAEVVRISKPTS